MLKITAIAVITLAATPLYAPQKQEPTQQQPTQPRPAHDSGFYDSNVVHDGYFGSSQQNGYDNYVYSGGFQWGNPYNPNDQRTYPKR